MTLGVCAAWIAVSLILEYEDRRKANFLHVQEYLRLRQPDQHVGPLASVQTGLRGWRPAKFVQATSRPTGLYKPNESRRDILSHIAPELCGRDGTVTISSAQVRSDV